MDPKYSSSEANASPLGKAVGYRSDYAPELLFPIPRIGNRREIGIDDAVALPFVGEDLWNAYELSWLNPKGKPVVALGEFRVPVTSPNLIESKSLKLYLNSFVQTRFAGMEEVAMCIAKDLSAVAGADVKISVRALNAAPQRQFGEPQGVCLDDLDVTIDTYAPASNLLQVEQGRRVENEVLYSHLLKSNCLVTGQPDWGMLVVRYSGVAIERAALLRYIVSFREHNEFHEQCVERIFMDITQHCQPEYLAVWARYTRRGGLDINPLRASSPGFVPDNSSEVRQ